MHVSYLLACLLVLYITDACWLFRASPTINNNICIYWFWMKCEVGALGFLVGAQTNSFTVQCWHLKQICGYMLEINITNKKIALLNLLSLRSVFRIIILILTMHIWYRIHNPDSRDSMNYDHDEMQWSEHLWFCRLKWMRIICFFQYIHTCILSWQRTYYICPKSI